MSCGLAWVLLDSVVREGAKAGFLDCEIDQE